MDSWLVRARKASGLSSDECARLTSSTGESFADKERNPGTLTLNELRVLLSAFNEEGRRIVFDALEDLAPRFS